MRAVAAIGLVAGVTMMTAPLWAPRFGLFGGVQVSVAWADRAGAGVSGSDPVGRAPGDVPSALDGAAAASGILAAAMRSQGAAAGSAPGGTAAAVEALCRRLEAQGEMPPGRCAELVAEAGGRTDPAPAAARGEPAARRNLPQIAERRHAGSAPGARFVKVGQ